MINLFALFQNEGNGIFRNMFKSKDYWSLFHFDNSPSPWHPAINAFNFSTEDHWFASEMNNTTSPAFLSFCFHYFKVKASGYEITTANYTGNPKLWSFSASNDQQTWSQYGPNVSHSMSQNDKYYVSWNTSLPFRCFRLECYESTNP